ncbi:uncharacterized protein PHACADRAFT_246730 [Phanerochaete carnosa HHB-10118-sp]|uniref:DUF6533 domain-containing protein n=1 Tax=Phanerochaete carnosa (strain HHB-10118-sp) TaxID=650164 RepID=K5XCE9_PHACS|nr:uncharacterized protein PHACADRAFT_246730 [Phanerochaete carnosa HHB-10118-sp]EKM60667.1 hypothetical protein PHACADRAFT_246730 [Phanerochaete carnosa HHB-10118-sp]
MRSPTDIELGVQVTYATACATAWLAWDAAIHFDLEIECIWRRPRSLVKWAYAFIRYTPILHGGALFALDTHAHFSSNGCRGWVYEQLIFVEVLTFVVEAVLVMRLYVLYNQNKLILWAIILAFIAEVTVMIVCLSIVLPQMTFSPDCLVAHAPSLFMSYWLSSLAFETFLFVLTLIKFFQSISRSKTSIVFIFVRDGTWAFALIFVAMLLNMLMYKLNKTPLVGMGYGWAFAAMSFAGSHVLLNLRRLSLPEDTGASNMSAMAFNPRSQVRQDTTLQTAPDTTICDTLTEEKIEPAAAVATLPIV